MFKYLFLMFLVFLGREKEKTKNMKLGEQEDGEAIGEAGEGEII